MIPSTGKSSYENPVCTGWSMYSIFDTLFQLHGFSTVELESDCTMHGPLWPPTAWVVEARPGPPWSQTVSGAVHGETSRLSKNQKKMLAL